MKLIWTLIFMIAQRLPQEHEIVDRFVIDKHFGSFRFCHYEKTSPWQIPPIMIALMNDGVCSGSFRGGANQLHEVYCWPWFRPR